MGCSSCSKGGGIPAGCKSNGSCGTYGCNNLDVFDWLADVAPPSGQRGFGLVEVRFKGTRKAFYRNSETERFQVGDVVAVEGNPGHDIGVVSASGELVRLQLRKHGMDENDRDIRRIYRRATTEDMERWREARSREDETMFNARRIASSLKLDMKISDVEFQGDGSKATFYYTADDRVDFRQLIREFADNFSVRVEMRQIGARQEASRVGGIGSCGRELCCSTWLTDFRTVSTSAARYQQLSINPQKLAGQCGKLKCCLNYELDSYLDALKDFPDSNTRLKTKKANAFCIKTDIFQRKMWFLYENEPGANPVCLMVEEVKKVIDQNKNGIIPHDLKQFEFVEEVEVLPDYENVVGQDSLNRFDTPKRKKKRRKKPSQGGQGRPNQPQARTQPAENQPQNQASQSNRPKRRKKRPGGKPRPPKND